MAISLGIYPIFRQTHVSKSPILWRHRRRWDRWHDLLRSTLLGSAQDPAPWLWFKWSMTWAPGHRGTSILGHKHSYGKSPFLMGKSTINGHFRTPPFFVAVFCGWILIKRPKWYSLEFNFLKDEDVRCQRASNVISWASYMASLGVNAHMVKLV